MPKIEKRWVWGLGPYTNHPVVVEVSVKITSKRLAVLRDRLVDSEDRDVRDTFVKLDTHFSPNDERFCKTKYEALLMLHAESTKKLKS